MQKKAPSKTGRVKLFREGILNIRTNRAVASDGCHIALRFFVESATGFGVKY